MGKIFGYDWLGETLRVGFDLTIAVAAGFFSIRFLWGKSGGKGERYRFSRFKSSNRYCTAIKMNLP